MALFLWRSLLLVCISASICCAHLFELQSGLNGTQLPLGGSWPTYTLFQDMIVGGISDRECASPGGSHVLSYSKDSGRTWGFSPSNLDNQLYLGKLIDWQGTLLYFGGIKCGGSANMRMFYTNRVGDPGYSERTHFAYVGEKALVGGRINFGYAVMPDTTMAYGDLFILGGTMPDYGVTSDVIRVRYDAYYQRYVFKDLGWADWSQRAGHAVTVTSVSGKYGRILVAGGLDRQGANLNDVWIGSSGGYWTSSGHDDEVHWYRLTQQAPWIARTGLSLVTVQGNVFTLGGWNGNSLMNDVWVSSDDGKSWMLVAADAGYLPQYFGMALALGHSIFYGFGATSLSSENRDSWLAFV